MCLSDKTHIFIKRVSYGANTQDHSVKNFCVLRLRHTFNVTNLVNALIYRVLLFTSSLLRLRAKTQFDYAESS